MKLKRESQKYEERIKLDPAGIYRIGGFGTLIELHPIQRQIVKHALTGELLDKRSAAIAYVDKKGYYYVRRGETMGSDAIEFDQAKPSNFNEMWEK